MYLLRTLGASGLWRISTPVEAINSYRSALAILIILATDGPVTRDRLMALLWPESDTDRARGSLKQTLHVLRRQTEGPPVVLGRSTLHLNTDALTSDVASFRAALDTGDHAAAVARYGGPFLDGTHLGASRELQQWVDSRREALSSGYRQALRQLVEAAEDTGNAEEAVRLWRRIQAEDPYDDVVSLRLMRALAAAGQRAAALRHFAAYEVLLREEVGLTPSTGVLSFAGQLRQREAEGVSDSPPERLRPPPPPPCQQQHLGVGAAGR